MSTPEIITALSPPPCENSLLFRLTLLLPEIALFHNHLRLQTHQTALPDALSGRTQAGTADVLPKRHPRSQ